MRARYRGFSGFFAALLGLLFLMTPSQATATEWWESIPVHTGPGADFRIQWGDPMLGADGQSIELPLTVAGVGFSVTGGTDGTPWAYSFSTMFVPNSVVVQSQWVHEWGIYWGPEGNMVLTDTELEVNPWETSFAPTTYGAPSNPSAYGGMAAILDMESRFVRQYPHVYGNDQLFAVVWVLCDAYEWVMDPSDPSGNTGSYVYSGQARIRAREQFTGATTAASPHFGRPWPTWQTQLPPELGARPGGTYPTMPPYFDLIFATINPPTQQGPGGGPGGGFEGGDW
jgi:hypothetical protein